MKTNISNIVVFPTLFLLILVAVFDIFIPEDDPRRIYAISIQAIILSISFFCLFKTYSSRVQIIALHKSILIFSTMLIVYGLISPNLSKVPVLLYGLLFFYFAYYLSYTGRLQIKHIQTLAIFLLIVYSYETYLSIFERAERLGIFYRKADNVGYNSLALMLLFALDLKKIRSIIFLSLSYILVILSFKRGAMIAGTLAYIIAMWPIFTGKFQINRKTRRYLIVAGVALLAFITYESVIHWDVISYRFASDKTGGSGRTFFWSLILKGWQNADLFHQAFGFGLFEVPEYLRGSIRGSAIYAHSDWFELLYDHGILGILLYCLVVFSLVKPRKTVYRYADEFYHVYLMVLAIWVLKSIYAGVYINKVTIFSTLVLGTVLAVAYRNKNASIRAKKIKTSHNMMNS